MYKAYQIEAYIKCTPDALISKVTDSIKEQFPDYLVTSMTFKEKDKVVKVTLRLANTTLTNI